MSVQFSLVSFSPLGGAVGSGDGSFSVGGLPRLSFDEAVAFARSRVKHFPVGGCFTFNGLFTVSGRRVQILNKRGRVSNRMGGVIAKVLQRDGLVEPVGVTTEDQECRNSGLATKWRVVKNE